VKRFIIINYNMKKVSFDYDGVLDFGRVKDRYLTRKGLKPAKMKIEDFFLQCKNKGLKKIL